MAGNATIDMKGKSLNQLAESDSELMRVWGEINNAWDDIERLLYLAFDAMLAEETMFATHAVFYSQRAHAARRDMVEELAKYALTNRPTTAHKLKNAMKRVRARAEDRHRLTHGTWMIGVDLASGEQGLRRVPFSANATDRHGSYSRKRLLEVRDQMRDTARALREAIAPIEEAKRARADVLMERHVAKATPLEAKT